MGRKPVDATRAWLEKQDAHTLHRTARKRFARNPDSAINVMDVWECELVNGQAYAKYNNNHTYILSARDIFSKFLHMVPVKTKSGPCLASAFRSILNDPKYSIRKRRPIRVRNDKDKEFLNKHSQGMLQGEGVEFQICKNTGLKCVVVELVHRTFFIESKNIIYLKIPTDISKFSLNLSRPTITRFIRRLA